MINIHLIYVDSCILRIGMYLVKVKDKVMETKLCPYGLSNSLVKENRFKVRFITLMQKYRIFNCQF